MKNHLATTLATLMLGCEMEPKNVTDEEILFGIAAVMLAGLFISAFVVRLRWLKEKRREK